MLSKNSKHEISYNKLPGHLYYNRETLGLSEVPETLFGKPAF